MVAALSPSAGPKDIASLLLVMWDDRFLLLHNRLARKSPATVYHGFPAT